MRQLRLPEDFTPGLDYTIPPVLTEAREADSLTLIEVLNGSRFHLISRYEEVKAVMTSSDVFSRDLRFDSAPRLTDGDITHMQGSLMNMEGGEHRRIRSSLSGFFNRAAVHAIGPTVTTIAKEVLGALDPQTNTSVDVLADYVEPTVTGFTSTFMGVTSTQWSQAQDLIHAQLDPNLSPEQTRQAGRDLITLAGKMLAEAPRGLDAPPTPISALAVAFDADEISGEEARDTCALLLMNVTDPLIPPLALGIYTLLRHDDQRQKAITKAAPWSDVALEVLRFHNNGYTNFPRMVLKRTTLRGVQLEPGDAVVTSTLAAAHDPRAFDEPDHFHIDRAEKTLIPFGSGPHFCLGNVVAREVIAVGLREFFNRFPDARLDPAASKVATVNEGFFACPQRIPVAVADTP